MKRPAKPSRADIAAGDETAALVAVNRFLSKRSNVQIAITRDKRGATVKIGGGAPCVESNLRHAVNAALAGELLKGSPTKMYSTLYARI